MYSTLYSALYRWRVLEGWRNGGYPDMLPFPRVLPYHSTCGDDIHITHVPAVDAVPVHSPRGVSIVLGTCWCLGIPSYDPIPGTRDGTRRTHRPHYRPTWFIVWVDAGGT